jgi:hypothetical protein
LRQQLNLHKEVSMVWSGNGPQDYTMDLRRAIARFLPARGLPLLGKGRWTDRLLVLVMVLMALSCQRTLKDRFVEARQTVVAMYPSRRRPGKTCEGVMAKLTRQSRRLLVTLCQHLRAQMPGLTGRHWRIGKWLVFAVDGTKVDCPRTRDNQRRLKIGGRRKSGPQMLLVSLLHLGTGLLWSWRRTHARGSEPGLLREMIGELPPGALLVADAGFCGYQLLRTILAEGHEVLMRAGANRTFLRKLGFAVREHRDIVYLWSQQRGRGVVEPLIFRRILVRGRRGRIMCLLTSVLDPEELPLDAALSLYRRRWDTEVFYRGFKQTLARRKMLSGSACHALVELDFTVLGLWLLSLMQWTAARTKYVAGLGLAQALRVVRQAIARRGDARSSLACQLGRIQPDCYRRKGPKAARTWPHKKKDPPCGIPKFRIATASQIQRAKHFMKPYHAI